MAIFQPLIVFEDGMEQRLKISNPEAMRDAVNAVCTSLQPGNVIFLEGPLGAGKTTFVRAAMDFLASDDLVASPSFALINVYRTPTFPVAHFDLYRLEGEDDLETIGSDEFLDGNHLVFVEWPEKGAGFFPAPDIVLSLELEDDGETRSMSIREENNG